MAHTTPVTTTLTLSRTAIADIAPRSSPASLPSSASPSPRGPGMSWSASAPISPSFRRLQTSARTVRASVEWRWWRGSDAMAAAGGAVWKLERGVVGTRHAHRMPSSSPANSRQRSDMFRAVPPARTPARLPLPPVGLTSGVTEKASAMTVSLPPSLPPSLAHTSTHARARDRAHTRTCTHAQARTREHMHTCTREDGHMHTCKRTVVLEESTHCLTDRHNHVQSTHLNGCHRSQNARSRRGRGGAGRPLSRRSCRTRIWSRFPLSRSASLQACQHPSHCLCVDRWRPDKTRRKERKGETRRNSSDGEAIHLAPGVCRWQVMSA